MTSQGLRFGRTCSQVCRAAGFKGTQQVADLCEVHRHTVERAYEHNRKKFESFLYSATECVAAEMRCKVGAALKIEGE